MPVHHLWMLVTSLLLLGFGPKEANALRNVSLRMIPPAVQRGEHASLICQYDLEGEPLYSVKWYRGRHEFYRYSPSEEPVTKIFPYPGIHVDLSRSNESLVVLRKVGFNLSGNFSCEVTVDAPPFSTKTVTEQLQVVSLPDSAPVIMTEKDRYDPGETLVANCTSPASKPPASLSFLLNDVPGLTPAAGAFPDDPATGRARTAQMARDLQAARAQLAEHRVLVRRLRDALTARDRVLARLTAPSRSLTVLGCPERPHQTAEDAVLDLARRAGVKLGKEDIERSFRSAKKTGADRPITVFFATPKKKDLLLKAKRRMKKMGIDIVEDMRSIQNEFMAICGGRFAPKKLKENASKGIAKHRRIKMRFNNETQLEMN